MGQITAILDQILGKGFQNLSGALDVIGLDKPKSKKARGATEIGQTDVKKTTKKDVGKRTARSALLAGGQARGILSPTPTSGRGTLLGN